MVTILTAPRKSYESYLPETFSEVNRQVGDISSVVVVVDGDHIVAAGHRRVVNLQKKRAGNRDAFFAALKLAVEENQDLVFLEDDLAFCRNAVPYMEMFDVPAGVGWVQFFTPGPVQSGFGYGLHLAPPGTSKFNQAMKFPLRTMRELLAWNAADASDNGSADQALCRASKEMGIVWASHSPDLAEHIGAMSAFDDGRKLDWWRKAFNFPGKDFDAFSLRRMGANYGQVS